MLATAYYIGRVSVASESTISYIPGKTIYDTIEVEKLVPYKVEVPIESDLPLNENNAIDTAAIIKDYESKKSYNIVAFDNQKLGKLELFPTLQYNSISSFDYKFTPIYQRETIFKKQALLPFVSVAYSTQYYIGVGGGFFYHNLGLEYQYNIDLKRRPNIVLPINSYFERGNHHWFSGKYMFR